MENNMSQAQFDTLMKRLDKIENNMNNIESNMVRKADLFQSVLTVQGFSIALIVGVIVTLNSLIGFAN